MMSRPRACGHSGRAAERGAARAARLSPPATLTSQQARTRTQITFLANVNLTVSTNLTFHGMGTLHVRLVTVWAS
jgi:hypothetical protein